MRLARKAWLGFERWFISQETIRIYLGSCSNTRTIPICWKRFPIMRKLRMSALRTCGSKSTARKLTRKLTCRRIYRMKTKQHLYSLCICSPKHRAMQKRIWGWVRSRRHLFIKAKTRAVISTCIRLNSQTNPMAQESWWRSRLPSNQFCQKEGFYSSMG